MPKASAIEQYTPKGLRICIPTWREFGANLDKLIKSLAPRPVTQGQAVSGQSNTQV
jgi:hypothetical protein